MKPVYRSAAFAVILSAVVGGCVQLDAEDVAAGVNEQSPLILTDPGRDPTVRVPDASLDASAEAVVTVHSHRALPRERAHVDAGPDAECHDACPARCDEDEICCYSTGMCVPLECWECCPDVTNRNRAISRAAGEPP